MLKTEYLATNGTCAVTCNLSHYTNQIHSVFVLTFMALDEFFDKKCKANF